MDTESMMTERSTPCPTCGRTARLAPNPYYGTGLSVNPHVLTCLHCRTSEFVRHPRPARSADDAGRVAPGVWQRITSWLSGK